MASWSLIFITLSSLFSVTVCSDVPEEDRFNAEVHARLWLKALTAVSVEQLTDFVHGHGVFFCAKYPCGEE